MKKIISLLILASCGSPVVIHADKYDNAVLEAHIHRLQHVAEVMSVPYEQVEIEFTDLPDNTAGICFYETNKIYIDPSSWEAFDFNQQKILVAHEWVHCALGFHAHRQEGIMQPSLPWPEDAKNADEMIEKELAAYIHL